MAIASIAALEANHSKEIKLIGTCKSTDYLIPGTLSLSVTNITTVSNHTTTVYASTAYVSPTAEALNSTSYTTTLATNASIHFTTTNTAALNPLVWTVATCTFAP